MDKRRVVITGLGTVNPIGNTVADSWRAAQQGRSGIAPITAFHPTHFKVHLAGEVKELEPTAASHKRDVKQMARLTQFSL